MKLLRLRFALMSLVLAGGLSISTPRVALGQDMNDVALAKALWERGIYDAAESLADRLIANGLKDALVVKALAQAGRAKAENNPKLLEQAKKTLAEAASKGAKGAKEAEAALASPPPPKFAGAFENRLAWTLKNKGLIGAAEGVIDAAIKGAGLTGKDLHEAKLIRADLHGDRSRTPELGSSKPEDRKASFEKAKEIYLAECAPGVPQDYVLEAKGRLYDLYYTRGDGLLQAAKRVDDLAAQDALKKEALESFKAGSTFLEAECKTLDEELSKGAAAPPPDEKDGKEGAEPKRPTAEWLMIYANYYWPKCLVGQARATTDKNEHDSLVKKAVDLYNEYNLRFGQEDQGFEAAIDMADAYREIGDEDNAVVALESALAIEKTRSPDYDPLHPPDPKKGLKLDAGSLDVFARASLVKGKALKAKRDFAKALTTFDKVLANAKASNIDYDKEPLGKAIKIERAECLAKTGKMKEAQADLNKLIAEDQTGPVGQNARAMLARLAGGGGGGGGDDALAGVTGDRALKLMEDALGKDENNTAANYARIALRLCKAEGTMSKIAPNALFGLGQAYENLGRFYEATVAYEEVTRRYADNKQYASASALGMVKCYQMLKSRVPNDYDKDQYEKALRFLTEKYPNEGKGVASFLLALQHQEESEFEQAAKAYANVPPEANDIYDKSLYSGALCRYLFAKQLLRDKKDAKAVFTDVEAGLRKAIDTFAQSDGVTDERKKKRADLDAEARFLLADVLLNEAINKPKDVLSLLEKADTLYDTPDRLSRAGFFRVLAHVKLGELDKAEEQCKVLLEKYKGQKRTILAAREVATALDKDVTKNKDLAPEKRREIRGRMALYYARWILDGLETTDSVPSVREMRDVANRLVVLGLDLCNMPDDALFVGELDDNFDAGNAKQIFSDARDIYAKLAENPETLKGLKENAWIVQAYWAESAGFVKDWATCKKGLEAAIADRKLVDTSKKPPTINPDVAGKNKVLLAYYFDLGRAYFEMGAQEPESYERGFEVMNAVLNAAVEKSKIWWNAKLSFFKAMDKRGQEKDYKELAAALRAMERKYPDFKEAEKFGLNTKFIDLKKAVESKVK